MKIDLNNGSVYKFEEDTLVPQTDCIARSKIDSGSYLTSEKNTVSHNELVDPHLYDLDIEICHLSPPNIHLTYTLNNGCSVTCRCTETCRCTDTCRARGCK